MLIAVSQFEQDRSSRGCTRVKPSQAERSGGGSPFAASLRGVFCLSVFYCDPVVPFCVLSLCARSSRDLAIRLKDARLPVIVSDSYMAACLACSRRRRATIGEWRRSTIEVHPNFSEAPHVRSSIPLPKPEFSRNQNASRRIFPYGPSLQNVFFSKSRLTFRRFAVKEPRISETK